MEDEIDLREYVRVLLRRWRLIVGLTLVAALAALTTSFLLPPSFEATVLVAVTNPRYALQFDPRIETLDDLEPAYAAYPQLATSDEVLGKLLAGLNPLPEGVESLRDLREIVKAKAGADPSIVQLTVRSPDAQVAARVANAWAEVFVAQANALYGVGTDEQVAFFAGQAQQARKTLAEAEQALSEFQSRNQAAILEARLEALKRDLQNRLEEKDAIAETVRRARALQAKVRGQPASARVGLPDQLTALLLQTGALGGGAPAIQLQATDTSLSASLQTAEELVALLDSLANTLEGQGGQVDERVAALRPAILGLQEQLQIARTEEDQLTSERDIARDTYLTLARKVAESRIAAQDGSVRLASRAGVPAQPVGPRQLANVVVAGMLGFVLGVFGAFAAEWWRGGTADPGCVKNDAPAKPSSATAGIAPDAGGEP